MPQASHFATGIVALLAVAGTTVAAPLAAAGKPKATGQANAATGPTNNFDGVGPDMPLPPQSYSLATPGAASSAAVQVRQVNTFGQPVVMNRDITVYNRLLVKASDRATLDQALAEANATLPPTLHGTISAESPAGMVGYWEITAPSVTAAQQVTMAIYHTGKVDSVELDVRTPTRPLDIPTDPFVASGDAWHFGPIVPGAFYGLNLEPVYDMGYTGLGVNVGVLDFNEQPAEVNHPDLAGNFDGNLSQEFFPGIAPLGHSTSVSGIIGATAENGIGAAGIAYNVRMGALRNGANREQGEALNFKTGLIDIFNNSWGPVNIQPADPDVPDSVPQISKVYNSQFVTDILRTSAENGRGALGTVYMFAAGNDGLAANDILLELAGDYIADDYNMWNMAPVLDPPIPADPVVDGPLPGNRTEYAAHFTSSRSTIAIAAISEFGEAASYTTPGTGVLVGAPSAPGSGQFGRGMTTTDNSGNAGVNPPPPPPPPFPPISTDLPDVDYTNTFNGTSAATPAATGVVALMLEANPSLTVRDIKYILKETAVLTPDFNPTGIYGHPGVQLPGDDAPADTYWQVNGAFTAHSDQVGFGAIDAAAAVAMAADYEGLPPLVILDTGFRSADNGNFADGMIPDAFFFEDPEGVFDLKPGAQWVDGFCVRPDIRLEEVEVELNVSGRFVGDLLVRIISPFGTESILAFPRPDFGRTAAGGYVASTFLSYKHWDELSGGDWVVSIQDWIPDEDPPELPDRPEGDDEPPTPEDIPNIDASPFFYLGGFEGSEEKEVVSLRIRMYGTEDDRPPFRGCVPTGNESCPADFDGDGDIDRDDFLDFLSLWENRQPAADLDNDGFFTYADIQAYFRIFVPGFCNPGARPGFFPWGRPIPGVGDLPDIIPIG